MRSVPGRFLSPRLVAKLKVRGLLFGISELKGDVGLEAPVVGGPSQLSARWYCRATAVPHPHPQLLVYLQLLLNDFLARHCLFFFNF